MNSTHKIARWLSLALLAAAAAVQAQTVPVDLEAGARWVTVSGSRDMYRSQINEDSGFLIRSLTFNTVDFAGHTSLMDYFRLDVSDMGAGPAGAIRVDTGKGGLYRFRLGYRRTNDYSNLPTIANPFVAQGVYLGAHSYNRDRQMLDLDLELDKWSNFTPFFGYSFNRWAGPGSTTYHVGGDEFILSQGLRDTDNEFRVGTNFTLGPVTGQITQGWRSFQEHESLGLIGTSGGEFPNPFLGKTPSASGITRESDMSGHTPFTNAWATGTFAHRVKLTGNFVRFAATSSGPEDESVTGANFVDFGISRFFNGLTETVDSHARNTTWRGGVNAEVNILENLDLLADYQHEHRDLSGTALINTLYLQSFTFGGVSTGDMTTVLNANSSLTRNEDVLRGQLVARGLGPFSLRAGVTETKQDVTVAPDLSEIVVPGPSQGGDFSRRVTTTDISAGYGAHGFTFGASWKHDSANNPIFRTDFLKRDRVRGRAAWHGGPRNMFQVGVVAERSNPKNDDPNFAYTSSIENYSADAAIAPVQQLRLYGSLSRYRADSHILYRRPETFALDTSYHKENGKGTEGGATFTFNRASLDASFSRFNNIGTTPFTINRVRARATFDMNATWGIAAEWNRDKYAENSAFADFLGNYDANRYGVFLRWRQQ